MAPSGDNFSGIVLICWMTSSYASVVCYQAMYSLWCCTSNCSGSAVMHDVLFYVSDLIDENCQRHLTAKHNPLATKFHGLMSCEVGHVWQLNSIRSYSLEFW